MSKNPKEILDRFEAAFDEADRQTLAEQLLAGSLREIACSECGGSVFVFEASRVMASFECPHCHKKTFVRQAGGGLTVLSETRLGQIVRYLRARTCYCPEHDGIRAEITGVRSRSDDPFQMDVAYLCRRSRGWGRRRVHAGTMTVDVTTLEAEMAAGPAS